MLIRRVDADKEKELAIRFNDDKLSLNSVVPGHYKEITEISTIENEYHFMSAVEIKKMIEDKFGKSKNSVNGKYKSAKFFAFSFDTEILICVIESGDVGTNWFWMDLIEDGSRYGKPMLLPCDKEVSHFWPSFCLNLKKTLLK